MLAEIVQYRPLLDAETALSSRVVARLTAMASLRTEPSLYDGLGGDVAALRLLEPGQESIPLQRLADVMTPAGWNTTTGFDGSDAPVSDSMSGGAGVVMAAIWAGGERAEAIARTGGEALLRAADRTEAGLDWGMRRGLSWRGPNYSHGTAGVASALAIAGTVLGRPDFVEAAVLGAQHLLAVGSLDDGGFIVPHTIPPSQTRGAGDIHLVPRADGNLSPVRRPVPRRRPRGSRAGCGRPATAMPSFRPHLRCPAAPSPRLLGQRRSLLRDGGRRRRAAGRCTGQPGSGAS